MKRFIKLFIVILLFILIVFGIYKLSDPEVDISTNENSNTNIYINEASENTFPTSDEVKNEPIFTSKEIPNDIYEKMLGKSIPTKYKDRVDLSTIRYLQISYIGFDGNSHVRRNDCKL